jgi:enoyl-CoA hydratase/carnithine racemase
MAELDQGELNQGEPDQGDEVVVSVDEPVATVRLNRPNRANSVTPEVVTRLGEAVAELAGTAEIKAVVITGTGKVFCAGADVNEMYLVYQDSGIEGLCGYLADTWMPAVQRTVRLIWGAAKPVVAAFNGAATAGGLDFGLACDQRVASTRAKFA